MLQHAESRRGADTVRHQAEVGPVLAPDHEVLESARVRLSPSPAPLRPLNRHCLADIQAIETVIENAQPGAPAAPSLLDAGAALALLANARRQLDRLEADLLDTARRLNLSWDLIGAVMGLPAAAAEERARVLRTRADPQLASPGHDGGRGGGVMARCGHVFEPRPPRQIGGSPACGCQARRMEVLLWSPKKPRGPCPANGMRT